MTTLAAIPRVLSIAGSDPSGGAGLQADLKTFAALGCYGMAVPTALTAQNTSSVWGVHLLPADFVALQIDAVFADIQVDAVKIGMLGAPDIVAAVAEALKNKSGLPVVLDPVLVATSGAVLGDQRTVDAICSELIPLARLVTPNLAEASVLAGMEKISSEADMQRAAGLLAKRHPAVAWLIKGGHLAGADDACEAADLLLDDQLMHWFRSSRIATRNTHGTGCTLSSAIAAHLASGLSMQEAVAQSKTYLDGAIGGADRLGVGHGHGPLDHGWLQR